MTLKAEVLDALLAAGATAEMIVAAVKADMAEADIRREQKRENNAERQRRFKARKRSHSGNAGNALADVTPPIEEIIPPKQSFPDGKACIPKTRSKPLSDIPDDWQPILTPAAQRVIDGWPPGMFDRQLSAFRNHAADKGRKSKDWQAAFRTWIDNADKWKNRDDRPKNGQSSANDEPANPYVRATLARQAERAAGIGGQPDCWP